MIKIKLILVVSLLLAFQYGAAQAEIVFVDQVGASAFVAGTDLQIPATSGEEGEFEILTCITEIDSPNFFTEATPDWDNFNLGNCGGPNCIMGIFTKFSPESNNLQSTCFWNSPTNPAAGVVMRYSGVRSFAPVFDIACNTGIGRFATSPPIDTPEGSMVVRVFGANEFIQNAFNDLPGSPEFGKVIRQVSIINPPEAASLFIYGEPFPDGGTAGEVSVEYVFVDTAWRACTISLAMEGTLRIAPIPTMNEWGLIAFAALAGISAIFFIRRRTASA